MSTWNSKHGRFFKTLMKKGRALVQMYESATSITLNGFANKSIPRHFCC